MWSREPLPGDPVEDLMNHRVGIVVAFSHTLDMLVLADSEGNEWEVPLADTSPYAVRNE